MSIKYKKNNEIIDIPTCAGGEGSGSGLNMENIIVKNYSYTTTSNTYVSPFNAYVTIDLTDDITKYGEPISWSITNNTSTNPTIVNYNNKMLFIYNKAASTGIIKVIYNITNNIKNNKDNYSTEEQIIGTWIDGKPIYRKVFTLDMGVFSNGLLTITTSLINIKKFIDFSITLKPDQDDYVTLPYIRPIMTESIFPFIRANSDGSTTVQVVTGGGTSSVYAYATDITAVLEYTKTTD